MALIHCDFISEVLGLSTSMDVILPQPMQAQSGTKGKAVRRRYPTLYLLHGLSDDHTIWQRRTSIERYVSDLGLAVVMPAVHRSWYTDSQIGYRYWTFVSEELPRIARSFFPLSEDRKDNFVAGLSMGGYGAFKLAFRRPDVFCAAASLSGALDLARCIFRIEDDTWRQEFKNIFGDLRKISGTENDLFHLARKLARSKGPKPKLFQCCGTSDFLYEDNTNFRDHANKVGLNLTYEEGPGDHTWAYWDEMIQHVLTWLTTRVMNR